MRNAFETYLHKYNHGRGFVLIGHSQGSFVLEQLIAKLIDPKPALRKRMLSAILLGGNVLVKRGNRSRRHVQAHPRLPIESQLHCVIAYLVVRPDAAQPDASSAAPRWRVSTCCARTPRA